MKKKVVGKFVLAATEPPLHLFSDPESRPDVKVALSPCLILKTSYSIFPLLTSLVVSLPSRQCDCDFAGAIFIAPFALLLSPS